MKLNLNYTKLIKKKDIDLNNKGLLDDDLDILYKVIEQSTALEHLDLSYNRLTLSDGKLANAMAKNTTLQVIGLGGNNIGVNGVKHLANALKKNYTLQILDLGFNNNSIGDEGARCIADMLADNKSLQVIYLNHNNIGDQGVQSLAASLIVNTGIR